MSLQRFLVPPYILRHLAEVAEDISDDARALARHALQHFESVASEQLAEAERQGLVPVSVLQRLVKSKNRPARVLGFNQNDVQHVVPREETEAVTTQKRAVAVSSKDYSKTEDVDVEDKKIFPADRKIYDMKNSEIESDLPGKLVRSEKDDPVEDAAVNDVFDNIGLVLDMFKDKFHWTGVDSQDSGTAIVSSVHFGEKYENAYWHPQLKQFVFGDGDEFLGNFTSAIDVIGHKMTHAVTDNICPLVYMGMSGALNEHISDVFGVIVKQIKDNETAEEANWLIGEDCIMPGVKGTALRSMKAPGTAYDDPRFGKDPQPDHFDDYVPTFEDMGGVHIYSGIPNKAFYLAAKDLGGHTWDKAGPIWWATMNSGRIKEQSTFIEFANLTVAIAKEEFDQQTAEIVREAWNKVGVTEKTGGDRGEDPGKGYLPS